MADPIDMHVAARLRQRRLAVRMSQEELGRRVGVTFQQVQKYERGANRVSASRLLQVAELFGMPVSYFFEGMSGAVAADGSSTGGQADEIVEFISARDGLALNEAFLRIKDARVRKKVVEFVVAAGRKG